MTPLPDILDDADIAVAPDALVADGVGRGTANAGVGVAASPGTEDPESENRTRLLAALLAGPDTVKAIVPAWPLYMRLVLTEEGRMVTSYPEMGRIFGSSGRSCRQWVERLGENGIVRHVKTGTGIEIELLEPHASAATAPEVAEVGDNESKDSITGDQQALLDMVAAAKRAGKTVEMHVKVA